MAFNFLGTINGVDKFEEFEEFVRIESKKIEKKIDTLSRDKLRMSELLDKFKGSDQVLRKDYPLSERADIDYIKNPRPNISSPPNTYDALNATDVNDLKKFVLDQIKYKRENNEYKIKKIRDRMEQVTNEISDLTRSLTTFEDTVNNIRSRFNLPDFVENQRVPELDPKDIDDSIPVTPRNAGREIINGLTYYLALSIKGYNKSITFDTAAPTVKPYQMINIVNGKNNGTYTVKMILSPTTIQIFEDLVDENPATSKIQVL